MLRLFSVLILLTTFTISNGQISIKSIGTPEIKGTDPDSLSETWTVFDQENSGLPNDWTRAIASYHEGSIWIGTDNGVVKIENGNWFFYNSKNTIIKSEKYGKDITSAIRYMEVDNQNNKWFSAGWDVYKYDNETWTIYDSTNSPIKWAREIVVDGFNNIWFTSWEGVAKFDGDTWTVIDTSNSSLPSNKVLGVYNDSKNRLWIGTFEGNIMIENQNEFTFERDSSPLSKAYISHMAEDREGNLWFDLFNENGTHAGIYIYKHNNSWERITYKSPEIFSKNSINDFLLDEEEQVLWVSANGVGLMKYDIVKRTWEVYTNENSGVPSIYVLQIIKDKQGAIWAATFNGVIKLNPK